MRSFSMRKRIYALLLGSLLCLQAQAVVVTATATDLADVVVGQDRWRIAYRVSGEWAAFDFITLLLPSAAFSGLAEVAPPPASLDAAFLPASPPFDTVLTLTALIDFSAADSASYSLDFTLRGGLPLQPQALEVVTVDPIDFTQLIEPRLLDIAIADPNEVPEPASWMLVGLGMALLRRQAARTPAR